ncbi:MAG: hypothetical protein ACOCRO_00610 [Halanaerobiales bacterium]
MKKIIDIKKVDIEDVEENDVRRQALSIPVNVIKSTGTFVNSVIHNSGKAIGQSWGLFINGWEEGVKSAESYEKQD